MGIIIENAILIKFEIIAILTKFEIIAVLVVPEAAWKALDFLPYKGQRTKHP